MARYPARKGVVYLGTTVGGVASNVIALNHWTMDRTTDKIDVTSFGDSNKVFVGGLPDLKGTISGFWDDTETKPFAAAVATGAVNMYLYPSSDIPAKYAAGTAWVDFSMDTSVAGAVSISGNFAAGASWYLNL